MTSGMREEGSSGYGGWGTAGKVFQEVLSLVTKDAQGETSSSSLTLRHFVEKCNGWSHGCHLVFLGGQA